MITASAVSVPTMEGVHVVVWSRVVELNNKHLMDPLKDGRRIMKSGVSVQA